MAHKGEFKNLRWLKVWFLVVLFFTNLSFASNKIDGAYHTLLIDANQNLWGWGNNGSGQLGNGDNENKNKPIKIASNTQYQAIDVGSGHSMALDRDGNIWVWGWNYYGQLGDGTDESKNNPTKLMFNNNLKFQAISAGGTHSLAIDSDGNIWAWGYNYNGQLGDGTNEDKKSPVKLNLNTKFKAINGARGLFSVAIDNDGNIWSWGWNSYGQLGDGSEQNRNTPAKISIANGVKFKDIAAGGDHVIALDNDGNIWAWGSNSDGQLGDGTNVAKKSPVKLNFASGVKFKEIAAGNSHSVALDTEGNIWTWGHNFHGQLGDGTNTHKNTPTKLSFNSKFQAIGAGDWHTIAIDEYGNVWAWGVDSMGQLGDGGDSDKNTPQKILSLGSNSISSASSSSLSSSVASSSSSSSSFSSSSSSSVGSDGYLNVTAKKIAAGNSHTVMIDNNQNIWSWGSNYYGQLGDGTTKDSYIPKLIPFNENTKFQAIAAGQIYTIALDTNGEVWSWGDNYYGELGRDEVTGYWYPFPEPKKVSFENDIKIQAIAAGERHVLALDSNGNVWGWGANYQNQLGEETVQNSPIPLKLAVNKNAKFKAISAGMDHSLALDTDGNIWAWGYNYYGQLGNGTTTPCCKGEPKAQKIKLDENVKFKAIAGGYEHTLALDTDGNLWAWGCNYYGKLGDGTTKDSYVPKKITVEKNVKFKEISAGKDYSLALDTDGNIWSWGNGSLGQLGDGAITENKEPYGKPIPQKLSFAQNTKFQAIAAGPEHALAIDTNGNVWSWGHNHSGQLGNGKTSAYLEGDPNPKIVFPKSVSNTQTNTQDFLIPLNQGWNLIATPIEVTLKKSISSEFPEVGTQSLSTLGEYEVIWLYTDGNWLRNPDLIEPKKGYWLKAKTPYTIKFSGTASNLLASDIKSGWNLVGSGVKIENPKERLNALVIWVYRNNGWIKDPSYIDASEGVWVRK